MIQNVFINPASESRIGKIRTRTPVDVTKVQTINSSSSSSTTTTSPPCSLRPFLSFITYTHTHILHFVLYPTHYFSISAYSLFQQSTKWLPFFKQQQLLFPPQLLLIPTSSSFLLLDFSQVFIFFFQFCIFFIYLIWVFFNSLFLF